MTLPHQLTFKTLETPLKQKRKRNLKKKPPHSSKPSSSLPSLSSKSLSSSDHSSAFGITKSKPFPSKSALKKQFAPTSLTLDNIYEFLESHLPKPFPSMKNIPKDILKYYYRRNQLFSKFHLGIRLDYEGWFSVTPEIIAKYTAEKCRCDVLVDLFAGVGGNTIQFATVCKKVIAVEYNATRLACTLHNAAIYEVQDRIDCKYMDAFDFLTSTTEKPDIIFLSPPWGGPSYLQKDEFYFHMMPFDWPRLLSLTIALTSNLVMYLPRNLALSEIQALAQQIPNIQVEQVFAYGRSRALLIYTGSLACSTGTSSTKPKYLDFTKST